MKPGVCAQLYANVQDEHNTEKHQFCQICKQMNDLNHVNIPTGINKLSCTIAMKYTGVNFLTEKQKVMSQRAKHN